jgi:Na+-driven multidrug efflux pump
MNILCNWVLNFALMYLLCFYWEYGLKGIWISKLISENLNNLLYFILIKYSDWYAISEKVKSRMNKNKQEFDQKN